MADNKIDGLIPNRKQSKEKIGKLNPNQYHKDSIFEYNYELDAFKCPEGEYLQFFGKYIEPYKDPEKPDKIKRIYNNYEACKKTVKNETNVAQPHKHTEPSQNTDHKMQKAMNQKMEKTRI